MPSKIDQAFIDNLQNFTDSLEGIVELMREQAEKGDAVNKMLAAMDGTKMSDIAEDIKELTKVTASVDDRTKQILNEVKAARKQKETGMFEKIESGDNKSKIVDAVKVVTLIAAGVLAIGTAFKIIGGVDFLSVISISLGILAVSYAFRELTQVKELTPKKVAMIGLSIVTMATAITVSSLILKWMQPLDLVTGLSLVFISGALGIAAFLLLKALDKVKLKPKDIPKLLLLPIALPAIAAGITLSSFVLQFVKPIGFDQALSVAMIGIAMIGAAIAFKYISKAIDKMSIKDLLLASAAIPLMAGGIVVASWIFKLIAPFDMSKSLELVGSSIAMGLAMLAFAPTMYILSKYKTKELISGGIGILITSGAIVAASWILSIGNYDGKRPTIAWALESGLALLAFTPSMYILGKMNPQQLVMGGLGVIVAAIAIMATSWILSVGNYDNNYPSAKWALGTGLSLLLFTPAILVLGIIAMTGIGAIAVLAGAGLSLVVAATIAATSHILSKGNYKAAPPMEWAKSVSLLMPLFSLGMVATALIPNKVLEWGKESILMIADTIKQSSFILQGGSYTGGPTKEWAEGIALALNAFSYALKVTDELDTDMKPEDFINFIKTISYGMTAASEVLGTGTWTGNIPSKNWGEGVGGALSPFVKAFGIIMSSDEADELLENIQESSKTGADSTFVSFIKTVAYGMVGAASVLKDGKWSNNYPTKEWGEGVGAALIPFVKAFAAITSSSEADDLIDDLVDSKESGEKSSFVYFMEEVARTMVSVDDIFKGKSWEGLNGLSNINLDSFTKFIEALSIEEKQIEALEDFADAMEDITDAFNDLNASGIEKFNNLTASVTIMSAVDNKRLSDVIGVLHENKDRLKSVTNASKSTGGERTRQSMTKVEKNIANKKGDAMTFGESVMVEKYDAVLERMDMLLEYIVQEKSGENVNKSDSVKK